jgi:ribonuclease P protein component
MHVAPEAVQDSPSSIVKEARFATTHRLMREDGFDRVVQADSIADKHFKVFFARSEKNNARLGIIASKKSLPRAVDRNRIKRVIREAFRQHSIKTYKLDVVVMVRSACAQEPDMRGDILETLFCRVENRCAEL